MSTAAPGWYPDPRDLDSEIWWDGAAYTQSRPRAAAPAVSPVPPPPPPPPSVVAAAATPVTPAPPVAPAPPAAPEPPAAVATPAPPAPAAAVVPAAPAAPTPPAGPAVPAHLSGSFMLPRPAGTSPKSRTVAAILGFFLGGLGVDRFYLGNIGLGIAKLLVGWLTLGIWPLIDWIIILAGAAHDGDGLPVVNWS